MPGRIVRSGPLTWAQVSMWQPLFWRHQGERFPLKPRTWSIDGNVPLAAARAAWLTLARRHEVLRSSFALDPAGRPVQRVIHPDDFTAPVACAPVGDYEAVTTAEHRLDLAGPLWSVTIFHDEDGFARGAYLVAEHVLYDAIGLRNWRAQVEELIADPDHRVEVAHPIDLAATEPSADHPRVCRARERYRDSVAASAQVLIPATRQRCPDRYLRSTATYPGLGTVAEDIARHCQVSPPAVLTYLVGWLLARLTRHRDLPVDLLYGNRPAHDRSIVCRLQHVYFTAGFGPAPAATGIRELARGTIAALAHGRMPRNTAAQVRSAESARRGVAVRDPVMFNVLTGAEARLDIERGAAAGPVVDEWTSAGTPLCTMVVIVLAGADVEVTLDVDSAMITRADTAAMLADLPRAAAMAGDHPDRALADHDGWATTPFPLDDGLVRVGQDWVRPHRVAAALAAVPGVRAAGVEVTGTELVATVTRDAGVSFADIHEGLLAVAVDHTDVVAPSRYRAAESERDTWHVRDRPVVPPVTAAELAVRDAIRHTHGVLVEDFRHTYVTAGCDLDLVPAVVTELTGRGYTGLRSAMFTAPWTLRMVARGLRRPAG